jgi:HSP20 family protein
MERLRREMNRLFAGLPARGTATPNYPAMNVWANEDGAIVTAELPGIDPEEIDISVTGDTLTLTGRREPEALAEDEIYHRRERIHGRFTRTFQLPFEVEAKDVDAVYQKGVLHITLPRSEADKPQKITVKPG